MVLKLTKQELDALFIVFTEQVLKEKANILFPADLLINITLIRVFKKLRALKEKPTIPKYYGLNLSLEEAAAYYAYFTGCVFDNYEETMLLKHITSIHKVFTTQLSINEQSNSNTAKAIG